MHGAVPKNEKIPWSATA